MNLYFRPYSELADLLGFRAGSKEMCFAEWGTGYVVYIGSVFNRFTGEVGSSTAIEAVKVGKV
jgi:hypothetical protein